MMRDLTSAEVAVLGLLAEAPRHGYELEGLIAERGMREWTEIGFSSIYFLIKKLEAEGLVEAVGAAGKGKARRPYRATAAGVSQLAATAEAMIARPHPLFPRLLLGLANWPLLAEGIGAWALAARAAALEAEAGRLAAARAAQQPLPDFVDSIFDYSLSQIAAERDWLARTRNRMEAVLDKIDFRKTLKPFYNPTNKTFELVDVPDMTFVMVDGAGDPNTAPEYETAVQWLYAVSYGLKFATKAATRQDYTVPPLEGLWWADDPADFTARRKDRWRWTMMIMVPDFTPAELRLAAVEKARGKLGTPPESLRFAVHAEGRCLQKLHIGSYDDEAPALAELHDTLMPAMGLTFNGKHHEVYLSDPRKVEPAKLKTILRQPVRPK